MAELTWSLTARRHLRQIREYIAVDSPDTAADFVSRLEASADRLAQFPASGRRVPEDTTDRLREVVFGSYR